jgi:DNA-binding SARP family transcriptional activator
MGQVAFRLLGKFDARYEDVPLAGLDARKLQEFLCYLLLHRDRANAREALVELFCAGGEPEQARKYFRQVLWQLQAALNAPLGPDENKLLVIDPEWVSLNPQACVWLDIAQLEQAFALVVGRSGEVLAPETAQCLAAAVDLYRGDLLDGCYQDWCLFERERLQNFYLSMLDKLMAYSSVHGEYEAGIVYGASILRQDRARERTHQRLMQLYYLAGDRTAALRQYDQCTQCLREELGVTPSRRTLQLYQQICADQLHQAPVSLGHGTDGLAGSDTLRPNSPTNGIRSNGTAGEIVQHLKQSYDNLFSLHLQICRDLQTLEQLVDHQAPPSS